MSRTPYLQSLQDAPKPAADDDAKARREDALILATLALAALLPVCLLGLFLAQGKLLLAGALACAYLLAGVGGALFCRGAAAGRS
ncbi:hypothetical protein [Coralloluteibacterium stylophorae]|uniref:Uncharacterized protein n=1 Tax=Coralloluteibacterium stylophorae TaxID=1776034 RepID=A0A8J8AWW9_9GAMM|nr:hypothetical protein [Coralloluteibacterium stylophorae]MBS7456900.1 hypothetical protein [Coralloluteibacterium stylophorae]